MKLILFVSLLAAAYAHGDCGGDCLKACRSCGDLINDGAPSEDGSPVFNYGSRFNRDCKQAICNDTKAVMIVDGHAYKSVVCFQGEWHFGWPAFLEETKSAMCLSPGNHTCDVDATVEFEDGQFQCQCKPRYEDVTEEFESEEQLCSNCVNKKLNITFLIDNSGSMDSVLPTIVSFIRPLVQFLKASATGNNIAVVTSSFSYDLLIDWGADSYSETALNGVWRGLTADGQSYLGSGMEFVKAKLVQPTSSAAEHKLIVFTDGSVKHAPPAIKDITVAANNLEALRVETFVVATNDFEKNRDRQIAIANGVENNVFGITGDAEEDFAIVNKLQKRICN